MENTYTMIAADGEQYGPVSLDQLKGWIGDGRIAPTTKILRSDTKSWLPASDYTELGLSSAPTPPPIASDPTTTTPIAAQRIDPMAARRIRSGARWFFWIAGFSLVNTLTAKSSSKVVFLVGLGVTQIIDALTQNMNSGVMVATSINVVIAGVFALLGVFAWQRRGWSFIIGMILYGLDALIFVVPQLWFPLGFHVFVIFWMFTAWKTNNEMKSKGL